MFLIYFHMASHQRILPLPSSHDFASCTELGILMPNLCIRNQYFDFRFPMIRLRFASTCRIHHTNTGSPAIRSCTTYSSICTGYESFISLRVTHFVLPYFHWTRTSNLFVVSLQHCFMVRVVINAFCYFTSVLSYL